MTSPRETNLTNLAPLSPYFPRRLEGSTLSKYAGVEDEFEDINRQPTSVLAASKLTADVPVVIRRATFKIVNAAVTINSEGDADCGGFKICDLPDRNIAILHAEFVGSFLYGGDVAENDDGDWGVGTTLVAARPLADEDVSIIPAQAVDNIGATLLVSAAASGPTAATGALAPEFVADAAANALYMNFTIDDTQLAGNGSVTVNGTFDFWYVDLGNRGS